MIRIRRPRFIAEQARHANGPVGRLIAFIMARETRIHNMRAIGALSVALDDHILDVGCGPGCSIAELAVRAPRGRIVGIDPSRLMADASVRRNRDLIETHRVDIKIASAMSLPFASSTFDKVLCVHVIYFLDELEAACREIARVMKPGALLTLLFHTSAAHAASAFPTDIYSFRELADVVASLEAAGLNIVRREDQPVDGDLPVLLVATKRQNPVQPATQ